MNKTTEWFLIVFAIFVLGFIIGAILTLPFALLGLILLSFVNIFGVGLVTSYFNCAVTGAVVVIIDGLIAK